MRTGTKNHSNRNPAIPTESGYPVVVLENDINPEVWLRIRQVCRERDWQVLDIAWSGNVLPEGFYPFAAFVNAGPEEPSIIRLRDMGCHVIRVGRSSFPQDKYLPAVLPDMVETGRMAAEYFAQKGFQHMAFIGRSPWKESEERLCCSFLDHAETLGCDRHLLRWKPRKNGKTLSNQTAFRERRKRLAAWLSGLPKPVGLLARNDPQAAWDSSVCHASGIAVPTDVGILGIWDYTDICETVMPSLSSIQFDYDQIVAAAFDLLDNLLAGRPLPQVPVRISPCGIITRQSTDVFAVNDQAVATALRFIWEHYGRDITLDQVAEAADVSRRTLTLRFRNVLDRTVLQVLRTRRLDRAVSLLQTTELPIADVAAKTGFVSKENFYRTFRNAFDTTPQRFRKNA